MRSPHVRLHRPWSDLRAPDPAPELLAAYQPMLDALDDLAPRVEAVDVGVALVDVGCIHAVGSGRTMGQQRRDFEVG